MKDARAAMAQTMKDFIFPIKRLCYNEWLFYKSVLASGGWGLAIDGVGWR